jgi:type I restriction enzyme S subunit
MNLERSCFENRIKSYLFCTEYYCYYEKNRKIDVEYDIPNNWTYARLGDVITLKSGRDLEPCSYNSVKNGIPYITGASNIDKNGILINRWTPNPIVISKQGELLITCKGTIGAMCYNDIGDIHIARQIMSISSYYVALPYVKIFLETYINILQAKAKSMIPGISREDLLLAVIPIPPFKEQFRIVDEVNNIFSKLKDEI